LEDGSVEKAKRFAEMGQVNRGRHLRQSGQAFHKVPKVREAAEITLVDGDVMVGYVFVEATARIQDVLNSSIPFFPFIDENDQLHLINKNAVARVRPFDG